MNSGFSGALLRKKKEGLIPVIPDIKLRSPKEGDLLRGRDPLETAGVLAALGAPALSVVTEPENFGGSLRLLQGVVEASGLPVLRKDFIKDAEDLRKSLEYGARAVLLICAMQPRPLLFRLFEEAVRMGLEPLVEAHTKEELLMAGELGAGLVGINNRDILALEKDGGSVSLTEELIVHRPPGALLVSESSISSPEEAGRAVRAGADAVLVGTAIWQASDLPAFYAALCRGGRK
ncbi:MAG: indole-3-glycerol-phosphate synthase [Clostridiales bacterium]|nr:indole-3-glycerol-phosphate synthase [Clostridiales bacterium]